MPFWYRPEKLRRPGRRVTSNLLARRERLHAYPRSLGAAMRTTLPPGERLVDPVVLVSG